MEDASNEYHHGMEYSKEHELWNARAPSPIAYVCVTIDNLLNLSLSLFLHLQSGHNHIFL